MGLGVALVIACLSAAVAQNRDWDACADARGDKALAACTRFIENRGNSPRDRAGAYFNRAYEYKERGEFDRAIADLTEATRLDPKYARAFYLRGMVHRQKGDTASAVADFRKTLQLDPSAMPARKALQELELAPHRPAPQAPTLPLQAAPAAPPARSHSPQEDYAACTYEAKSVAESRSIDRAAQVAACTAAIASGVYRGAELAKLYSARVHNYYVMNDHSRAVADYDRLLELDPNADIANIYYRGESRMHLEDREGAIRDMQLFLQRRQLLPREQRSSIYYDGLAARARAALGGMGAPLPPPLPGSARDASDPACTRLAGQTLTVSGRIETVRGIGFFEDVAVDFTDRKTGCPMMVTVKSRSCQAIGKSVTARGRLKSEPNVYEVVLPKGTSPTCK